MKKAEVVEVPSVTGAALPVLPQLDVKQMQAAVDEMTKAYIKASAAERGLCEAAQAFQEAAAKVREHLRMSATAKRTRKAQEPEKPAAEAAGGGR